MAAMTGDNSVDPADRSAGNCWKPLFGVSPPRDRSVWPGRGLLGLRGTKESAARSSCPSRHCCSYRWTRNYRGRDMAAAHARFGITEPDFDKVVVHLVATLTELGVPEIADISGALTRSRHKSSG